MLFDMELPAELLDADIVHVEIAMSGNPANAVEDIFSMLRARDRLHGYIRVGQNAVNRLGDGGG